jgi:alkane 1-monooxygenase
MEISNLRFYLSHSTFVIFRLSIYYGFYYITILYSFGLLPLLDMILPDDLHDQDKDDDSNDESFKKPIYHWVGLYFISLIYSLIYLYKNPISLINKILMGISFGIITSQSIAVSHELSHKQNPKDLFLSKLLLIPSLYSHFFIEHKYGHHINVATPLDPATAKKNQTVYNFIPRSIIGGYLNAFKLEYEKYGLINYVTKSSLLNILILILLGYIDIHILVFYIIQALVGVIIGEAINYVEHYGLERKLINGRYESVKKIHSWDSSKLITNLMLFRIGRHSDHHTNPIKEYQYLRINESSPKLPFGYMLSLLVSFIPPLWFRIMNPILEKFNKNNEINKNI